MLELYLTESRCVHDKLNLLLERRLGKNFEIKRTENGKPYVEGNELYFSLSHSAGGAIIALCDKPVGIDFESFEKNRSFAHLLTRFTDRERQFTQGRYDLFLMNWVSKEAYIKLIGGTLARDLKRLEYYGSALYCDGQKVNGHTVTQIPAGVYSVCTEGQLFTESLITI